MKRLSIFTAALMLAGSLCFAQVAKSDSPITEKSEKFEKKIPIPAEPKDVLRAAIHKQDQTQKQISDLNAAFLQYQQQAQAKAQQLQAQEKQNETAIKDAEDKAYAAAGLDRDKYTLDKEAMEFLPKVAPEQAKK
jgi:hypothetical protein